MTRPRLIAIGVATLAGWLLALNHDHLGRLLTSGRVAQVPVVDDRVALLSAAQRQRIDEYHAALRESHDIDFRILAEGTNGDINSSAHVYFETQGVGDLSASGRGLLLVIDTTLDRVRLEVSTSLEGVYTDAFVAYVENRQMVPFFRKGRVADGILATTELVVTRAQDAEAGRAFAPPMAAPTEPVVEPADADVAGLGPLAVVDAYLRAMAARDGRRDLPIYSSATVRMLENRVLTPAQMDSVARTYRSCTADDVRVRGELAVVRYGVEQRRCAPYFLRIEDGAWTLDLAALSELVRFNHENQWHVQPSLANPYAFAFEDWHFDRYGFPHPADE
jgi:uncharacterized protein